MISNLAKQRWAVLFGIVIGVLFSLSAFGADSVMKFYDEINPVVTMSGEKIDQRDGAVFIRISGEKRRECRYTGLQTFGVDNRQEMHFVQAQYIGLGNKGTLPKGALDLGIWRLWPTDGAQAVRVYVNHDCNGRLVTTKIAEVTL